MSLGAQSASRKSNCHKETISAKIPSNLAEQLHEEAEKNGCSKTDIIIEALSYYLTGSVIERASPLLLRRVSRYILVANETVSRETIREEGDKLWKELYPYCGL